MTTRFEQALKNDDVLELSTGEKVRAREIDLDDEWVFKELLNAGFFDEINEKKV